MHLLFPGWRGERECLVGGNVTLEVERFQPFDIAGIDTQLNSGAVTTLLLDKHGVRRLSVHFLYRVGNIP